MADKKKLKEELQPVEQTPTPPQTPDLINLAVDSKPAEFVSTFGDLVKDRISDLVAARKLELSQSLFGDTQPNGDEEENGDEDEENGDEDEEENGDENENGDEEPEEEVAESWGQYKALDKRLNKEKKNEEGKRAAAKFKSPHTLLKSKKQVKEGSDPVKQPAPFIKEVPQKNTPITSNDRLRRAKFKKRPEQLLRK